MVVGLVTFFVVLGVGSYWFGYETGKRAAQDEHARALRDLSRWEAGEKGAGR